MNFKRSIFLVFILFAINALAQPQSNIYENHPELKKAFDLYNKAKYAAALDHFDYAKQNLENKNGEAHILSEYYIAICGLKLYHDDSEEKLSSFLKKYPDSHWNNNIRFELGNLYYRQKKYSDCLEAFNKVSTSYLESDQKPAFHYKKGYCLLKRDDKNNALAEFSRVKNIRGDFYMPANYYYGHLNYEKGRYTEALEAFKRIQNDKKFRQIIPYYIVQIYHLQEKPDELLAYAIPLLENAKPEKVGEISRLIGEAYYEKKEYEKALPYLEKFAKDDLSRSEDDNYQLGYCYYKTKAYKKAIKYLNYVTNKKDRRAQIALYTLGDCYVQTDKTMAARDAFERAYSLDFNPLITEDALFNYAKLAYELSYNPYHEAIEAFETYLNRYPESPRVVEANEFLTYVYLTTKNYNAALTSLSKINNKNFQLQSAYQYVAYNRAVELMLSKDYQNALNTFKKVSTYPIEKDLIALSHFWQGEILYNLSSYSRAIAAFERFMNDGSSYGSGKFELAQYNLAYSYFKMEKYQEAITWFRKFIDKPGQYTDLIPDAKVRVADGYFVSKKYKQAIDYYNASYTMQGAEADYAIYQSAICEGYLDNNPEKIRLLEQFVNEFPASSIIQEGRYELGDAYFKENKNIEALATFQNLSRDFPNSLYAKKALLQSGLIQYRNQQYEEALNSFKTIVDRYPNYNDSKEAIARAEDIYVELGRVDDYNAWMSSLTFVDLSQSALDSISYRAAENAYSKENCERSTELFDNYLKKFKEPIFKLQAHFYMAECYFKENMMDSAKVHYDAIAAMPANKFSEPALVTAAYLNYQDSAYDLALEQYKKLEELATFKLNKIESQLGLMRCYAHQNKHQFVLHYGNKLTFNSAVPEEFQIEARVKKANAYIALKDTTQAFLTYKELAEKHKTIESAMARYNMAEILFNRGDLTGAENVVFEMVNSTPIYDDWLAKSFILLGDIYVKQDNLFQAKATLKSVIDNHEGDDLKNQAQEKYNDILLLEAEQNEGSQDTTVIELEATEASDSTKAMQSIIPEDLGTDSLLDSKIDSSKIKIEENKIETLDNDSTKSE